MEPVSAAAGSAGVARLRCSARPAVGWLMLELTPTMHSTLISTTKELKAHAPFTVMGTLTGVAIMLVMLWVRVPPAVSQSLFTVFHPVHVLFSALATTAMYRRHGRGSIAVTILIGYVGSIGIATLSDCIIPYVGEHLLGLPNRGAHVGFIEEWWLVNPLAAVGIAVACFRPTTKLPHAGHVLLSTWASMFHMTMALGDDFGMLTIVAIALFLFLAVWIPCCTSDIALPLLFARDKTQLGESGDLIAKR